MPQDLAALGAALLDAARAAGAEHADVTAFETTSLTVGVRGGRLEQAERAEAVDIGLRVLIGRRQACVAASDTAPGAFAQMAERAVAMAREAPEDPHAGLADPGMLAAGWDLAALDLVDPAPEPEPAALQAAALAAEAAAMAVPGVTRSESATASYRCARSFLAASNGFAGDIPGTGHALSCVAITGSGTGMERDHYGDQRMHRADLLDPAEIGRRAGERTVARAGARKPPTGRYPVVFDERVAGSLIGHLLAAANGAAVARGASWLRDALGEPVLPDGIDLIEDPLRPRAARSMPFDGEGLPTARRAIVADGRLQGWLLDLATARKLGMAPTGNAQRGTAAPPSPGSYNTALTQGPRDRAGLLREMGTGLLVTDLIGSTINPNTGDYSRGASGHWVENGEIAYPVNELTIAGNLRDMLRGLLPANDARPHLSRVVPSLLLEPLTLAGA